jgi:hypothetical protein
MDQRLKEQEAEKQRIKRHQAQELLAYNIQTVHLLFRDGILFNSSPRIRLRLKSNA